MIEAKWNSLLGWLAQFGGERDGAASFNLQEQLIIGSSFLFFFAGFFWGILYFVVGEWAGGAIPLGYSIVIAGVFPGFLRHRNIRFYTTVLPLMNLLLPFLLQVTLGGFVNSSAVILWSFTSPLIALVLHNKPGASIRWFAAFLFILLVGGVLDPYVQRESNIPSVLILGLFVMNMVGVLGISFVLLYYLVSQREVAYRLLSREQEKSENLLLNILPRKIANILKNESRLIADSFPQASILFTDLVGFTPLSSQMSPEEMVHFLNEIYSHFDELVETYALEKIQTIGDNYMVAAGVPTPRPDHVQAVAHMALDILEFANAHPPLNGKPVQFRLGINSGPVLAGVIGQKKFHYAVWGDTVNTASRMESHSMPGKIQVTSASYELLKEEFLFEPRGKIEVKGKGELETWFLVGRMH